MTRSFAPGQSAVVVNSSIWTMLAVATIFLALRLYCRITRSGQLWWDDYILATSWALMLASSAVLTEAMSHGYFDYDMSSQYLFVLARVSHTCHLISLAFSKTSFAVTLLRVSANWAKYIIWFIIISIATIFTIHIFLLWRPMCGVPPAWVLPGACWDSRYPVIMNITSSLYSALTDFVLALLPWKVIMGLQIKQSEKISVALAMSVGVLAGVTGLMKSVQSILTLDPMNPEFMYHLVLFWIFSLAEPNTTIIAASIPILRVMMREVRNGYSDSKPGRQGYLRSTNSKFHGHNSNIVHTTSVRGVTRSDVNNADADSDRSILGNGQKQAGFIERRTEVTVEHEAAKGFASGSSRGVEEYELQEHRL